MVQCKAVGFGFPKQAKTMLAKNQQKKVESHILFSFRKVTKPAQKTQNKAETQSETESARTMMEAKFNWSR